MSEGWLDLTRSTLCPLVRIKAFVVNKKHKSPKGGLKIYNKQVFDNPDFHIDYLREAFSTLDSIVDQGFLASEEIFSRNRDITYL